MVSQARRRTTFLHLDPFKEQRKMCFREILRCILGSEEDDRRYSLAPSSDIRRKYNHHDIIFKSSSSYDTRAVTGRTNRDDWNWGSVNSISYGSVKTSPVNPPTVSSISYGSVKKSPVNPPTVTQTPFRLRPNHSTPKVTHKQICLPPSPPSTPSVHQNNPVDSAINGKSTIINEQRTSKSSPAKGNEGTRTPSTLAPPPTAAFSKYASGSFLSSYESVKSPVNPTTVNSISYGSVKKSPVNPPSVTQTPLRLPPSPSPPKVTPKPICLPPPPSPYVLGKKPVDSAVDGKRTIKAEQEAIKSSQEKGNKGARTPHNLAPAPLASFSKHSSEAFVICSSRSPQSSSKLVLSSSGPISSASKATPASLKAPPCFRGPHPSASKPTLSLSPSPFQNDPISVVGEDTKRLISTASGPSSSELFPSPSPSKTDTTNLPKKKKSVQVRGGKTPTFAKNEDKQNLVQLPSFPHSLPPVTNSPQSSPKLPPFRDEFPSAYKGTPSPSTKTNPVRVRKGTTLTYEIPKDIKNLIKRDIVPNVLKEPLSPRTYKDYFATLLYAEDFYIEKWSKFCLENVTLELEEASVYNKSKKNKSLNDNYEYDEQIFVVFEINLIPERRPFLLSRDFVFLRPAGKEVDPFKGILHRVVKGKQGLAEFNDYHHVKRDIVLAEFGDDFHIQHSPEFKYDVSFSFNRVCLKRSHQAIAAATNLLFQNFLFPDQISRTSIFFPPFIPSRQNLDWDQISAVRHILRLRGSPPYLIDGPLALINYPLSLIKEEYLSRTGLIIREAVLQIYKFSPDCRILVSATTNKTCDRLAKSLDDEILKLDMFRANAAFRERDDVSNENILHLCQYEEECFTCPPLEELKNFKVIFSTFVSSFRLHNKGLPAGHFSHIFMVDASSAMEPEALVLITSLVDENTKVVVTGSSRDSCKWVRSDIARRYGLKKSYFQRLLESEPYCCSNDSMFVTHL
ncbi:hypothetical protein NE237_007269 [Protea cynaroides]|uniref:RNA helicase SDE3 n=1 Tax=Protea cynaroides TaxID=273540 RepID=A0A9Q0QVY4_9MAGN|nr:hypothetical protein NE237_007269 [Protea cynaroides]